MLTFKERRQFIERGRSHGDVGFLLMKKENGFSHYKGFGTIEAPYKELRKIVLEDWPTFEVPCNEGINFSCKVIILDLSETNKPL